MPVLDQITGDLSWRETELATLKVFLQRKDTTNIQKSVLLRAAWAMLYAHYEGFSKFCLTIFYGEIGNRVARCADLPTSTKSFALEPTFKAIKNLPLREFLQGIEQLQVNDMETPPRFPDVDTKSNLWPNVLRNLLDDADLVSQKLYDNELKLRTLVARRNAIAHGQQDIVAEVSYYLTFEDAVYDVMYDLAFIIDARLNVAPYV